MLVRPPKLTSLQQNQSVVISQSHKSKASVSKGKNKKKQSSLKGPKNRTPSNHHSADNNSDYLGCSPYQQHIGSEEYVPDKNNNNKYDGLDVQTNMNCEEQRNRIRTDRDTDKERDNGSVGSYASAKSKKNKKKQTSLNKNKNIKSVHSNQSNINHKSMQDSIKVMDYAQQQQIQSSKHGYQHRQLPIIERSQVKNMGIDQSPYQFRTMSNNNTSGGNNTNKPFSEIEVEDEEDIPVIQIKQRNHPGQVKVVGTPKIAEGRQTRKLGQFMQKNNRNDNMNRNSDKNQAIENNSSISASYWNNSNVIDSQHQQTRKSRSKLGALFKQKSRQKNVNMPNQSKFDDDRSKSRSRSRGIFANKQNNKSDVSNEQSSLSTNKVYPQNPSRLNTQKQRLPEESRLTNNIDDKSCKLNTHVSKYNNIQKKQLDESQDQFDMGEMTKSQLNLSQSHNNGNANHSSSRHPSNAGKGFAQKDSVCFNIQPERIHNKRKGLGVVSSRRNKNSEQMVHIQGQLKSVALGSACDNAYLQQKQQMVKIPQILESRPIDAHAKLMKNLKQNQKYLNDSGFSNNNSQYQLNQNEIITNKQKQQDIIRQKQQKQKRQQQQQQQQKYQKLNKQKRQRQRQKQQKQRFDKNQQKLERVAAQQKQKYEKQQSRRRQQQQQQKRIQQQQLQQQQQQQQQRRQQQQREIQAEKQRKMKVMRQKRQRDRKLQQRLQIQQMQKLQDKNKERQCKQIELKKQYQLRRQQEQQQQQQIPSLEHLPSSYSKQHSANSSQRSRSLSKAHKKKQSSVNINVKKRKKYVGEISPRAEESFYEYQQSNKGSEEQKGADNSANEMPLTKAEVNNNSSKYPEHKTKLISFSEEEDNATGNQLVEDYSNKYKTDVNFYENSIRAPSSKPPLSKKSMSSKGKSKPKQTSLNPNKAKVSTIKPIASQQPETKKLSLVQLALQKGYEPRSDSQYSNDDSQYSFGSREEQSVNGRKSHYSKNSRNSMNSRHSKKSNKKQSVILMKQNSLTNFNRPPSYRKASPESIANKTYSHQKQLHQIESERQRSRIYQKQQYSQPIVSKGCSFIDERGRLVQKDMIIRGNKVYSGAGTQFNPDQVYSRLRKSRQSRKSRSKSKSMDRSRVSNSNSSQNITNANNTMNSFKTVNSTQQQNNYKNRNAPLFVQSQAYCDSAEQSAENFYSSQNYHKQNHHMGSRNVQAPFQNSIYKNSSRQSNATLNQFLKPVQSQFSRGSNKEHTKNSYTNNLYELHKNQQQSEYNQRGGVDSRQRAMKKRTMQRTQKAGNSASKKQIRR